MKALKKVPSDAKGLGKLPTEVRNKMGYMKKGGKVGNPNKKSRPEVGKWYMKQSKEVKSLFDNAYDSAYKRGASSAEARESAIRAVEKKMGKTIEFKGGGKVKKKGKKPNYKKTETFQDYKSAAATFQDFDPGKDTVFVGASIDPGVADKKAQRQANISSSKGASKSNYNDSKMYRTKNEAGQDVYVSLRKYDKYKKGGKVFKPHKMYKDGKAVMAKSMADHLRLKKQGYTHKKG